MIKYAIFGLVVFLMSTFVNSLAIKQDGKQYCKASGSDVWLYNGIQYSCKELVNENRTKEYI